MTNALRPYFALDVDRVVETAVQLTARVDERFPESGLSRAAREVQNAADQTKARIDSLRAPHWPLRALTGLVLLLTGSFLAKGIHSGIDWSLFHGPLPYADFIGVIESTIGTVLFLTAFVAFLWSLERRWKNERVLAAVGELRSLVHVVDMHQLTKDPERTLNTGGDTKSSPVRDLTPFLLGRYLDYCSELLSICSKVAALYAQAFPHTAVLQSVDEVEMLATGLSRKIWQKLVMVHRDTTHTTD